MSVLEFVLNGLAESGIEASIEIQAIPNRDAQFRVSVFGESHLTAEVNNLAPLLHAMAMRHNPKSLYAQKRLGDYNAGRQRTNKESPHADE